MFSDRTLVIGVKLLCTKLYIELCYLITCNVYLNIRILFTKLQEYYIHILNASCTDESVTEIAKLGQTSISAILKWKNFLDKYYNRLGCQTINMYSCDDKPMNRK